MQRSLAPILTPRRVAVVGASVVQGSPGDVLLRNLATFPGEVVPVSRTADTINGSVAYKSLRDVPGHIDLAVVAVPAAAALSVVHDAVAVAVGACVIVSAGFAETGDEGRAVQDEMVRVARAGGVLLVGPNCLGVQNCDLPLNASLSAGAANGGGGISLITQSGSYAMALNALSADEGVGFAVAYSSGNRCDIDDAEVIDYLRADSHTEVVCAFLESLGDGREFLEVARRTTRVKPLVVTTVGRSEAGSRAAASHTAALASNRRAWDDVLAAEGVTVARSGLEMLDAARAMRGQPLPRGSRAAIVTNSGGTGTELSDLLADEGVSVPLLSAELRARLDALLPSYASSANPVDITPVWSRFAELYPEVIDALARSGEVDLVIPVLLHRSAENPDVASAIVAAVQALRDDDVDVPVYACWVARRSAWPVTSVLHSAGIPCLEWPARTARALGHAVRYAAFRRQAATETPAMPAQRPLPPSVGVDAQATREFLLSQGIPVVETIVCANAGEAATAAARVGYPVVAKVDQVSLLHKSDVGGVRVGLADEEQVRSAAAELLLLAPGARVLIQPQVAGLEFVVGGLREPTFGPVVGFGLGGVLVEVLDDVSFAAAPLDGAAALALMERPHAAVLLDGVRGGRSVDRTAVATVICAVGNLLATWPEIAELDLNPLMVGPSGVVAVDTRLMRAKKTTAPEVVSAGEHPTTSGPTANR